MNFIYSNYTASLESTSSAICSYLTGSIAKTSIDDIQHVNMTDSPNNAGSLIRFDFIPQSGSLKLLEVNGPPGICSELTPYVDFDKFSNNISGSYDSVKVLTWSGSNNFEPAMAYVISHSLSKNNISMSVEYRQWNRENTYASSSNTEYILTLDVKNYNKNRVEATGINKEAFRNTLASCSIANFTEKLTSFDSVTANDSGIPDVVIKNKLLGSSKDMYFFDLEEVTGSLSDLSSYYVEKYIQSDIYNKCNVNMTSHFIWGTNHFHDITNYSDTNNFQRNQPIVKAGSTHISSSESFLSVGGMLLEDGVTHYSYLNEGNQKQPIHNGLMVGTKITLSDGSEKNIENLVEGDKVMAYTLENCNKLLVKNVIYDDRDNPSSTYMFDSQASPITSLNFSGSIQTVDCVIPSSFSHKITLNSKVATTPDQYIFSKLNSESNWRFNQGYEFISGSETASLPDITGSSQTVSDVDVDLPKINWQSSGSYIGYKVVLKEVDYYHDHYFLNCGGLAILEF